MSNMRSPEQTAGMVYPVQPVIHKIFEYDQYDPIDPWVCNRFGNPVVIKKGENEEKINTAEQEIDTCIQQHQVNILYCILPGIAFLPVEMAENKFQPDHDKIDWCADQDQ